MRELNEEQIKGLKAICNAFAKETNLTLTLSHFGYPDLFIVKRGISFLLLYSDDKRLKNYYYLIYTLMLLVNDGDVLFVNDNLTPINQSEKANNDVQYKEHIIKDETFLYFLNNNWNKTIMFSSALINYIDQGRTPEQIRFKKNQKATWTGIIIAIVIGLIGIVFNIVALCKATKLDISQLKEIEQTIQKQKIPEVIKTNISIDTLKQKVIDLPKRLKD